MTVTSRSAWTQCAGSSIKAMNFAENPDHMISLPNPQKTKDECRYCGGNCPNEPDNSEYLCDGFAGDIDNLYHSNKEVK